MLQGVDTALEEAADKVSACGVQVGEVCAIRFVEVVVAFGEGGVGGCDYRGEEGGGT